MDILKGSGSTFSTSGKAWNPFRGNRTIGAQNAKRARIVRKGLGGNMTKQELRALADSAAHEHRINHIPAGKRTRCDRMS